MRIGMKPATLVLLLSAKALARELFVIRNPRNQKVAVADAENVYVAACAVVKRSST